MKTNSGPLPLTSTANADTPAIRAFLAEESPALMARLARALERDKRVTIVGSAMFGPRTFTNASSLTPDLAVLDEHFAGVDCGELTRRLKELPKPPTVFIVSSDPSRSRSVAADADAVVLNGPNLPRQIGTALRTFFGQPKRNRGQHGLTS
jgi:chemotaxis response regulator CheB